MDEQGTSGLAEVRAAIDGIDERIVALIGQRQAWVEQAGRLKRDQDGDAVRAPSRVDAVIGRVRDLASSGGASPEVVERTYRAMIAAFIDLEMRVHAREDDGGA